MFVVTEIKVIWKIAVTVVLIAILATGVVVNWHSVGVFFGWTANDSITEFTENKNNKKIFKNSEEVIATSKSSKTEIVQSSTRMTTEEPSLYFGTPKKQK